MEKTETKFINLLDIIQQTELITAKIHGVLNKEEIFGIVESEFRKSKKYLILILLLSDNERDFYIKSLTLSDEKLKLAEKITGINLNSIRFSVENAPVLTKVIEKGETYYFKSIELAGQILPGPLAFAVSKITGHYKKHTIVSPLKIRNRVIGIFAIDSPELIDYFTLSVRNLALNISVALEFAEEADRLEKAKNDLLRSETKYRALYDSTTDAIMLLNEKGFFDCNHATLKLFGCAAREEFCSKHPADLSPQYQPCGTDSMILANQRIGNALETGSCKFEWLYKKASTGETFPAEVLLSRMELDGNMVLQATVRDITSRKKAEEELQIMNAELEFDIEKRIEVEKSLQKSENKYHTLLENASDAIIISDMAGNIMEINSKVTELTGYLKDELLNKHFTIFVPVDELNKVEDSKRQLMVNSFYKVSDGNVLRKNSDKVPVDITGNIIEFDNQKVVQTIIRDMSEQKILKDKLVRISDAQLVLHDILLFSLQKLTLDEVMDKILDRLLSVKWLAFESKGAFFLVDKTPGELVLKVNKNLSNQILDICSIVPFGRCLCGKAALNHEIVFSQHLDETHENTYDGILSHGHYCIPLINNDTVIGVINVYLKDNYIRRNEDEEFLTAFASLVTKIIIHYQHEEEILKLNTELEIKINKRTEQLVKTNKFLNDEIEERKLTENLLLKSNERYDTLIKITHDGFWTVNIEGYFLEVNDEYCVMTGYSREDFLKMHIRDIEAVETEEITREHIKMVITQGWDRFETKHRCADGKIIDVEISAVFIASQSIILVFIKDITELKKSEKELRKLNHAVESSNEVVFITDKYGIFTFTNPEFTKVYGFEADDIVGKTTPRILKSGLMASGDYEAFWQALLNKQVVKGELINKTKDGKFIHIEGSASTIFDESGDIVGFLAIQRDITDRKKIEDELIKSKVRLEQMNITKDKFFSIIAHDLKNPFAGIISSCELLKRNIEKQEMLKIEKNAESIHCSSKKAYAVLEDLLNWARLQMGNCKVKKEEFNIHYLISDILSGFQNIAAAKEIEMIVTGSDKSIGVFDIEMFKIIIRNFTANAIKFSNRGDKVIVGINRHDDGFYKVSVTDSGVGIKEEDLIKLFRIDVSHTTRGTACEKGTGLGLVLCKEFAEKNGSEISVKSEEGKGSTFSFSVAKSRQQLQPACIEPDENEKQNRECP